MPSMKLEMELALISDTDTAPTLDKYHVILYCVNQSLNEISKVPEVLSYCCLHKVRDAGVTMVSAVYDFLYLFGEAFGQVNGVVSVLPASHSMIIQPLLVNKVYIYIINILLLAKYGWLSHGKPKT